MATPSRSRLPELLAQHEAEVLQSWTEQQLKLVRRDLIKEADLRDQCREFLRLLTQAAQGGDFTKLSGPQWGEVKQFLTEISRRRGVQGFTPSETATFVFSLKRPFFDLARRHLSKDAERLADELWATTELLDALGLVTTEAFQRGREEIIQRQQQDMLELSTPVVSLWEGILALPIIGTLDSARSQVVMESLLTRIVETGSELAIIDITGVPTVDTLTAQHLLKTVTAARLMGAECIISGIRPQIAQTIVHLGVDLNAVITKSSLADAFALALRKSNRVIARVASNSAPTAQLQR